MGYHGYLIDTNWGFLSTPEWCPLLKRKELEGGKWVDQHFPPNKGGTRDIPVYDTKTKYGQFHPSVTKRIQLTNPSELNNFTQPAARPYRPENHGIGNLVDDTLKPVQDRH